MNASPIGFTRLLVGCIVGVLLFIGAGTGSGEGSVFGGAAARAGVGTSPQMFVGYDPESPAAFEYKLRFMETRGLGAEKGEKDQLFGSGVEPVAGGSFYVRLLNDRSRRPSLDDMVVARGGLFPDPFVISDSGSWSVLGSGPRPLGLSWLVIGAALAASVLAAVAVRRRGDWARRPD